MPASESMVVWLGGTGRLSSQMMILSGWSKRLWPMPGMSWMTGMSNSSSWVRGPMPESRSRRGVSTAPAQRIVSFFARSVKCVPDRSVMSTPVTVDPVTLTRLTHVSVRTVRLGRLSSPRKIG